MKCSTEMEVSLPTPARPMVESAQPSARSDPLSTACHENEVPQFVEAEIERRYGSLFSTLPHFRHIGKLTPTISIYITRKHGKVETVLRFDRSGKEVTVLNELIGLSKKAISEFAAFVFARYKSASTISFNAITADLDGRPSPFLKFVWAEDTVIGPLTTVEEYSARLTKNNRNSIRRHTNAILRAHPSYTYSILPSEAVSEELVRRIIGFNKARMADKERGSAHNDKESEWTVALARARGMVGVVTIDGEVCAGAVCCNVAGRHFMLVGAHDTEYDQFSPGTLCCYQSFCGSIADTGYTREARLWLLNAEGQENLKGRMADRLWHVLRRAKQTVIAMESKPLARLRTMTS